MSYHSCVDIPKYGVFCYAVVDPVGLEHVISRDHSIVLVQCSFPIALATISIATIRPNIISVIIVVNVYFSGLCYTRIILFQHILANDGMQGHSSWSSVHLEPKMIHCEWTHEKHILISLKMRWISFEYSALKMASEGLKLFTRESVCSSKTGTRYNRT